MIRLVYTIEDHQNAIDLVQEFLQETPYNQAVKASDNREYLGKLIGALSKDGLVWIAYKDNQPAGILISLVEPNVWAPSLFHMRELVWFVRKTYRTSSIGGRLFKAYCDRAEELMHEGHIQGYFTTQMTTTSPIDLESRGFKLMERTYLKDH
jgi:hypothetical protein